jgi:hypothetical protein
MLESSRKRDGSPFRRRLRAATTSEQLQALGFDDSDEPSVPVSLRIEIGKTRWHSERTKIIGTDSLAKAAPCNAQIRIKWMTKTKKTRNVPIPNVV